MSWTAPVYNDANFRAQFPQFANTTQYPEAALSFAWAIGANWMSQNQPACWGVGANNPAQSQMAADLMGAVVTYQLYGPASTTGSTAGEPTYSQAGEAPGAVSSATEGSVSASFQLPAIGDSAFASMLLASPPYGRMLLALLQISANVGPYIGSRRGFNMVPP